MKKSESLSIIISAVMALMFISGCSEPRRVGNPNAKIYIDSVPAGAHVYLAPSQDEHTWKDLGITPLVLNPSECPRKEFFIMIEMDEYIKKIEENIPELKEWVTTFKSMSYGNPPASLFFNFYNTSITKSVTNKEGKLVALGPVLKLNFPFANRICVAFIPRGERLPLFYRLMSPPDTFKLNREKIKRRYIDKLGFSEQQANEAIEALSRCGHAVVIVKNPLKENKSLVYTITFNGPDNDNPIIEEVWEWDHI